MLPATLAAPTPPPGSRETERQGKGKRERKHEGEGETSGRGRGEQSKGRKAQGEYKIIHGSVCPRSCRELSTKSPWKIGSRSVPRSPGEAAFGQQNRRQRHKALLGSYCQTVLSAPVAQASLFSPHSSCKLSHLQSSCCRVHHTLPSALLVYSNLAGIVTELPIVAPTSSILFTALCTCFQTIPISKVSPA